MKVPLYLSILVSVCLLGCKTAKQQPALVHESGQSLSEIKTLMEKGKSYFISTTQYPNYLPDNGVFLKAESRKLINLNRVSNIREQVEVFLRLIRWLQVVFCRMLQSLRFSEE